ncbi:MAG: hypothetical protein JXC36_08260 [Candidatus Atribacteria bacterium]|nr:hypothetical protein [Candidatus Atribacteria bacterium]
MKRSKSKVQSQFHEIQFNQSPVEFAKDALLKVQLVSEQKSKEKANAKIRRFWILTWAGCALILIFSVFYIFSISQQTPSISSNSLSITPSLTYPTFISRGDEFILELTLINESINYFSNVKAIFLCEGGLILKTDINGSTAVNYGDLNIGERKTRQIKFVLKKSIKGKCLNFKINLVADAGQSEIYNDYYRIIEFPIPYLRKILRYLFGLIGALIVSNIPILLKGITSLKSLIF